MNMNKNEEGESESNKMGQNTKAGVLAERRWHELTPGHVNSGKWFDSRYDQEEKVTKICDGLDMTNEEQKGSNVISMDSSMTCMIPFPSTGGTRNRTGLGHSRRALRTKGADFGFSTQT